MRLIEWEINGLENNTYMCWDLTSELEDRTSFNCRKRGLLWNGDMSEWLFDFIDEMPGAAGHGFKWSDELTISAQQFLHDMKGCAVEPYRVINDGTLD